MDLDSEIPFPDFRQSFFDVEGDSQALLTKYSATYGEIVLASAKLRNQLTKEVHQACWEGNIETVQQLWKPWAVHGNSMLTPASAPVRAIPRAQDSVLTLDPQFPS